MWGPPLGHGGMELRSTPPKAPKNNQFKHKLFTSLHTPKKKRKEKMLTGISMEN